MVGVPWLCRRGGWVGVYSQYIDIGITGQQENYADGKITFQARASFTTSEVLDPSGVTWKEHMPDSRSTSNVTRAPHAVSRNCIRSRNRIASASILFLDRFIGYLLQYLLQYLLHAFFVRFSAVPKTGVA